MTKRSYRYFRAPRLVSFFGQEPTEIPAWYFLLQLKLRKMTTNQYILWKQHRIINEDYTQNWRIKNDTSCFIAHFNEDDKTYRLLEFDFTKLTLNWAAQSDADERSVATDAK